MKLLLPLFRLSLVFMHFACVTWCIVVFPINSCLHGSAMAL